MRRLTAALLLSLAASFCSLAVSTHAYAEDDARRKQAAAEAYDRGTAAYLAGDYSEAAQWFETANRMSPAAPALVQAIRSHQRAENFTRAATLALSLQQNYGDDKASAEYAASVLEGLTPQYLRVDVTCDEECELNLDGKVQEFTSFFLDPSTAHKVTAGFKSGSKTEDVEGEAGTTKTLEFVAPPPPKVVETPVHPQQPEEVDRKPLAPIYTFIGAGLTGVLGIGTVLSGLDANAGAPDYKKAADASNASCAANKPSCADLHQKALKLLDEGQSKETRTNILIAATAVVGVSTAVIAVFFTEWSSGEHDNADQEAATSFGVAPTPDGAFAFARGRF